MNRNNKIYKRTEKIERIEKIENIERSERSESTETPLTEQVMTKIKEEMKCAPGIKFEHGSCIELPLLIEIADAYNKENNNKIKLHKRLETLNPSKYKKYLLKHIGNRLKNICNGHLCWTRQNFVNKMNEMQRVQLEKFTFRPEGPNGRFEWLNTVNIDEVMMQYETFYDDFEFLGAVPVDFDDLPSLGIKDLDYKKLLDSGKNKIGIIFNLDEHWKSGSHWTAGYADLKKGEVYYYDSYGSTPPNRIRTFLRRLAKKSEELCGTRCEAQHNKIRHQYGNSECGLFSLNCILSLLEGKSFDELTNSKVSDDEVNKLRTIFFRNVEFD